MEEMTVEQERWPGGLGHLRVGEGKPLLFLPGLAPDREPGDPGRRRYELLEVRPFARSREVRLVTPPRHLRPGTALADLAALVARAVREELGGPVDVIGHSTGGSIALQLAADAPDVVRRLVVLSAAHRLGTTGARSQRRLAARLAAGDTRAAGAELMALLGGSTASRTALRAVGWLVGPRMFRGDQRDLLTLVAAEDSFALLSRLPDVVAPTLVVGGDRDAGYEPALFEETAAGVADGRLVLYRGRGHLTTVLGQRYVRDALGFLDAADPAAWSPDPSARSLLRGSR